MGVSMGDVRTPREVIDSVSPRVKKLFIEIMKYEQEYLHIKNLSTSASDKEKELCDRIIKLIEKEART